MPEQVPPRPELRFLARFTVELNAGLWDLGPTTTLGRRRIVPITGGRFDGPLLTGEILDNGADWQVVADDGATVVDTRYLLRTNDGALVYLRTDHAWLNRAVAVGSALRLPDAVVSDAVVYDAYLVA